MAEKFRVNRCHWSLSAGRNAESPRLMFGTRQRARRRNFNAWTQVQAGAQRGDNTLGQRVVLIRAESSRFQAQQKLLHLSLHDHLSLEFDDSPLARVVKEA